MNPVDPSNRDDVDRVLRSDDEIRATSGFTDSVMSAVLREASVPAPIPFPWKRAWPGFVAGAGALAGTVIAVAELGGSPESAPLDWPSGVSAALEAIALARLDLVVLALALTFGAMALSSRLVARRARIARTDPDVS